MEDALPITPSREMEKRGYIPHSASCQRRLKRHERIKLFLFLTVFDIDLRDMLNIAHSH
jgi:hypothetical protein